LTPPQDYDDSYLIKYAEKKDAVILSNDRYRDWIEKATDVEKAKKWRDRHVISFTFILDEFMPNPDFMMPRQAEHLREVS